MKPKDDSGRGCEASEVGTEQQATQLLGIDGGDEDEELKIDYRFLVTKCLATFYFPANH
jgi:hypothetical protein